LDILEHALEVQTALDVLPGETLVRILTGNRIILKLGVFPQLILLSFQAVAIDLDRRRDTRIDIALLFLLNHLSRSLICFLEASANALC
jgi:hypothetical protein